MNFCVLARGLSMGAGLISALSIVRAQTPSSSAVGVFVELHSGYYTGKWLIQRWLLTWATSLISERGSPQLQWENSLWLCPCRHPHTSVHIRRERKFSFVEVKFVRERRECFNFTCTLILSYSGSSNGSYHQNSTQYFLWGFSVCVHREASSSAFKGSQGNTLVSLL